MWEEFNSIENRHCSRCPTCANVGEIQIAAPAVHGFKLGYFEHLGPDGTYAHTKKELKEACERYGSYAPGVLD